MILDMLLAGVTIELDNGWRLTTTRIAGDEVVELVLNGVHAYREELCRDGLSEEIIGHKRRRFVLSDEATNSLKRLFGQHRPVRNASTLTDYRVHVGFLAKLESQLLH